MKQPKRESREGYVLRKDGTKDDASFFADLLGEDFTPEQPEPRTETPEPTRG